MNICILSATTLAHRMGGTEIHLKTVSETAVKLGHLVSVITTRHPEGVERERVNGVDIYYLPRTNPSMSAKWSMAWRRDSLDKFVELHKNSPYDIVWAENTAGFHYAKKFGKPYPPIISMLQGGGIGAIIRSEWNRISTFPEFGYFITKGLAQIVLFYLPWIFWTVKYSDMLIFVSEEASISVRKEFKVSADKIKVVCNGLDTGFFKPDDKEREKVRASLGLEMEDRVIMMAGVAHKQKGMHIGLKVFEILKKRFHNLKCMIVGDGPQLPLLRKTAEDLNIATDIVFCGSVSNMDMPRYYNVCDIFLNPTLRVEGHPFVLIEAMSCGKPVVTSLIGGTASTIDDGKSGFFTKPGDAADIVKKCGSILENPELMELMGNNSRKKVLTEFTKEKMTAEYIKISGELIARV